MTTRRHVLQWLATAPALAACSGENLPDPIAAWRDPGAGETDPRRFALAHAILAPSPHNTQPWLVDLDDAGGMTLSCDLERRLPFTDPFDRQITLGCGAFLDLYARALRQAGFYANLTYFPEGEPSGRLDARPVAYVRTGDAVSTVHGPQPADPMFNAITARRTNRNPFDPARAPAVEQLDELVNIIVGMAEDYPGTVAWTVHDARVARLRDLVWRGFDREMRTEGAAAETYEWLRFGKREIARRGDGLAIDGPLIPLLRGIGVLNREALINPDSEANKQAAQDWRAKAESAPAFLWLTSRGDTPSLRLTAGQAYAKLNLAATDMGIAMHPWSQTLQEYPEIRDLYDEMKRELNPGEETLQMLVRIGYGETPAPSARRGLAAIMRAASP